LKEGTYGRCWIMKKSGIKRSERVVFIIAEYVYVDELCIYVAVNMEKLEVYGGKIFLKFFIELLWIRTQIWC